MEFDSGDLFGIGKGNSEGEKRGKGEGEGGKKRGKWQKWRKRGKCAEEGKGEKSERV